MDDFKWPDVVQVDPDTVVTRQVGIPPEQAVAADPVALPEIVQGSADMVTTRQRSSAQFFGSDGVLYADHPATGGTLFSDGPFAPADATAPPVDIAPAAALHDGALVAWAKPDQSAAHPIELPSRVTSFEGDAKTDQPGDVIAADKPAPGQQVEGAPQVFSAEQLASAKAAKKAGK